MAFGRSLRGATQLEERVRLYTHGLPGLAPTPGKRLACEISEFLYMSPKREENTVDDIDPALP